MWTYLGAEAGCSATTKDSIPKPPTHRLHEGNRLRLSAARRSQAIIFVKVLLGWFVTLLISLAIYAALHFYSDVMSIMSTSTKRQFNALITALSLALGFSVAKGLGEIMSMLRWWLLSRRYYSHRQVRYAFCSKRPFVGMSFVEADYCRLS